MSEQYKDVCRGEFKCLRDKLDRLDQAIRGNGNAGILTRIDRLESAARMRGKLFWLALGSILTCAGAVGATLVIRLLN